MPLRPRFHTLEVAEVRRETRDCVSVAFRVPAHLADSYGFVQGQYLTLRRDLGGGEVRRSYSICAGTGDGELRIAVKKVAGGLFSTFVNEELGTGDRLDVMTPDGRFHHPLEPDAARRYALFAAGSGITPVMSVARTVLARQPASEIILFYGNRTAEDVIFRDALDDLKSRHLGRLAILHILSREDQETPLFHGRIDGARAVRLLEAFAPAATLDEALICGPDPMADAVGGALADAGLPRDAIRTERFVGNPGQMLPPPGRREAVPTGEATVTAILDGAARPFPMAFDGESIVDAGHRNGIDLPYSCKGGMCCTCRAKLVSGRVDMVRNYSLEPWELEAGFVLTCQSRPTTPAVTLDYDAL